MQRVILFLSAIIFISFSALPQMRMDPAERTKQLKEQLNLSDDQAKKVEQILTNAQNEAREKISSGQGNRSERREAMRPIMDKAHEEIMKLLNEEQKEKYKKIIEDRRRERDRK